MWNLLAIRLAGFGPGRARSGCWICTAVLWGSAFGAAQPASDVSTQNLRASVSAQPAVKPVRPLVTAEQRGDIYMARKMYRDAIDMYRESPPSPGINNKIGIAFQQLLVPKLAKKYYEAAINENRNFAEALNNLGTLYYTDKSYGRAISYFKRSLKCSGPIASTYANIGAAYFARKDYKTASAYYQNALRLDPDALEHRSGFGTRIQDSVTDLAMFHLYLARTYAKAGSNERALTYLRKALEEGIKNRNKLAEIPEFAALKDKPAFKELLAENPKPL